MAPPTEPGRIELRIRGADGAPDRRFALRPRRLALALIGSAAIAWGVGVGAGWALRSPPLARLQAEVERGQARIAELTAALERARATPAVEPAPAETSPQLALPVPPPGGGEPGVRLALLRGPRAVLTGEGLVLESPEGGDSATPLSGRIAVSVAVGTLTAEGLGALAPGARIVNRLGPIGAGGRDLPESVELYVDGADLVVVGEVPMERYVAGVVGSELPAAWQPETRKAQAVAARTYALMQRALARTPWHLETTVDDQVYRGKPVDAATAAAVAATHGEVVTVDGFLASTFFHSTCGGRTEDPAAVWPERASRGVRAAPCGYCDSAPTARWQVDLTPAELLEAARTAGRAATEVRAIHVRARTASGRAATIELDTDAGAVSFTGNDFRRALGWTRLKSTWFDLEGEPGRFHLAGRGLGHGVGLCQWGAEGMARSGLEYRAILDKYYPGTRVQRIY